MRPGAFPTSPFPVNTTACKRLFSLGCVPHTDGAAFQLKRNDAGVSELQNSKYDPPIDFSRSMRRAQYIRHGDTDYAMNRTALGTGLG